MPEKVWHQLEYVQATNFLNRRGSGVDITLAMEICTTIGKEAKDAAIATGESRRNPDAARMKRRLGLG